MAAAPPARIHGHRLHPVPQTAEKRQVRTENLQERHQQEGKLVDAEKEDAREQTQQLNFKPQLQEQGERFNAATVEGGTVQRIKLDAVQEARAAEGELELEIQPRQRRQKDVFQEHVGGISGTQRQIGEVEKRAARDIEVDLDAARSREVRRLVQEEQEVRKYPTTVIH